VKDNGLVEGLLPVLGRREHSPGGVAAARVVPGWIHSKIAEPSCSGFSHLRVSNSSRSMVEQNDSIIELSTLEAARPMDPSGPASRSRPEDRAGVLRSGSE
jgi:hypothetical protein